MLLTSSCKEIQSKLSTYEFDIVNKEKYSTFIENEKVDYILVKYYFEKYLNVFSQSSKNSLLWSYLRHTVK